MTNTAPAFGRGGDSAVEADEALAASRGGNFRRIEYLPNIGKGKSIFIRYLDDSPQWYYCMAHPSAPTKNKPSDWPDDRKFPESMPAVCRYDKAFTGIYSDCYICDAKLVNAWDRECKPVLRVWALAVIREEVLGTQAMVDAGQITADKIGKRVGFKDATREVEETDADGKPTGKKVIEPRIIVVNKAMSNYFAGLQSMYGVFGTVCDRDYVLVQSGEKKDVEFQHINLDPTPNHQPGTESWKRYEQAIKNQGLSIPDMLMDRSSDEFFATFFDPSKTAPPRKGKAEDGSKGDAPAAPAAQQQAAASNDVDPDRLAAMRARVRGGASEAPAEAPAAPQAEQAQQPAAVGAIDFS